MFLKSLGVEFSHEEIAELYLGVEAHSSGNISFNDFWKYYSVGLPKGLVIDEESGIISGTPTKSGLPAVYVITCLNPVGEVSAELRIEIQEAPDNLLYSCTDCLYILDCATCYKRLPPNLVTSTLCELGEPFEVNTLTYTGSKVLFTCDIPLPNGLHLNSKNGSITGIPKAITAKKGKPGRTEPVKYKITGKNQVASSSVELLIEIAKAPSVLKYKKSDCAYSIGEAIADNEVLHCDGTSPYCFTVTRDPVATKACFDKYDGDFSGSLELSEFRKFIRDLGETLSEAEFRWLVAQVDKDGSGSIEFGEFWEWWKPLPYGLELDEKTGTIYGRPLRRCPTTVFIATVWSKVGSLAATIKMQVLDETTSRDRDADRRRQFWYTGRRRMEYPGGDLYDGEWDGGRYHGQGIFSSGNGYRYEGGWRCGKRHGYGCEVMQDGVVYEGEFVDNARHGNGVLRWPSGGEYVGEFQSGRRGGRGRQTWRDGDGRLYVYEGEWEDDVMHGRGMIWEDGRARVVEARRGAVLMSVPAALSTVELDLPDGSKYHGEARESGEGDASGTTVGRWVLHGQGRRAWPSGEVYVGEYQDGLRHGRGKYIWPDGTCYDGHWRSGQQALGGIAVEGGQASIVWHDPVLHNSSSAQPQLRLQAPAARVPLACAGEAALGLGLDGQMLRFCLQAKSSDPEGEDPGTSSHGKAGNSGARSERLTLPPLPEGPVRQARSLSVLSGYRDGTSLSESYVRAAQQRCLPAVVSGGMPQPAASLPSARSTQPGYGSSSGRRRRAGKG